MATELIVHTIPMVEVLGSTNIPTILTYSKDKVLFGQDAAAFASQHNAILNEDFKVDLGNYDPSRSIRKRFATSLGSEKSAAELTYDFLSQVLNVAKDWLSFNGLEVAPSILLAEPLNDPEKPAWVRNYRANLVRILRGKGFKDEQIDFLPEPFAVFQFYRYGYRHPSLADTMSYRALVLDFGGGTFDACVVESKKDGDISQSGKNSKPLGASSTPVGGYEINRQLAEHLALKTHESQHSKVRKGLDIYKRWRNEQHDLSAYSAEYTDFIHAFDKLVHDVEASKLILSRNLVDWNIDNIPTFSVPVKMHKDLFSNSSPITTVHLKASDVKQIFCTKIWPRLRDAIRLTIANARAEMQGGDINAVLLSGGSSSFGWVRTLLQRDFGEDIRQANILSLPEYHEIVAKGLAIECARRYAVDQGDFGATTYNRLCLTLDPGEGQELPKYLPRFTSDRVSLPEGVLVPASTALAQFIDKPLRWKFRLSHAPKQKLGYYFLRSNFDPDDVTSLQNVEEQNVFTPPRAVFDSQIQVELMVGADGTAKPKFIYKTGADGKDSIAVEGRPFYLDMTTAGALKMSKAYLGIDFGTSNSAMAYLSKSSMDMLKTMSNDSDWLSLNELINSLPFPLARSLNRFLGGSSSLHSQDSFMRALEFMEAAVALLAYIAYLELRSIEKHNSRYFKGFTQRSIGPLWGLLRDSLTALGKKAVILSPALRLIQPDHMAEMNNIVQWFSQKKHQKAPPYGINLANAISFVGNICNDVFKVAPFGFFEDVRPKRFGKGYSGRFRIAHGTTQPFPLWMNYEGAEIFSDLQAFVIDPSRLQALCAEPLIFWDICKQHPGDDEPHLFFFDKANDNGFDFKAISYECALHATADSKFGDIVTALSEWKETDPDIKKIEISDISIPDGMESDRQYSELGA